MGAASRHKLRGAGSDENHKLVVAGTSTVLEFRMQGAPNVHSGCMGAPGECGSRGLL
jgi:hypothetical protein